MPFNINLLEYEQETKATITDKLKIKRNDWLLASNQSLRFIFELETVLKFYYLEARSLSLSLSLSLSQ